MFNVAAATCGSVELDASYPGDRIKFENVSIMYEKEAVVISGLATGDLKRECPGCSKQIFVQLFNKSSSSFVGVQQIRCHGGTAGLSFDFFETKYELAGALFEGHDFELRAADTWNYCGSFKGGFDATKGYGTQQYVLVVLLTFGFPKPSD